MSPVPAGPLPDPAAMLRLLPVPTLEVDDEAGDDLRRIELRRAILDIAEVSHKQEAEAVRDVVERFRRAAGR